VVAAPAEAPERAAKLAKIGGIHFVLQVIVWMGWDAESLDFQKCRTLHTLEYKIL
jgi:hypothetical protein